MRQHALILIFFAFWSFPTSADDYKIIASNKAQITMAEASGVSQSRSISKLWSVFLRAPEFLLPGEVAVVKMYSEFNCSNNTERFTVMTTYKKDYSLVQNQYTPKEHWKPIVPDTQNAALKDFACGSSSFRQAQASVGAIPLEKLIASAYAGPWPGK